LNVTAFQYSELKCTCAVHGTLLLSVNVQCCKAICFKRTTDPQNKTVDPWKLRPSKFFTNTVHYLFHTPGGQKTSWKDNKWWLGGVISVLLYTDLLLVTTWVTTIHVVTLILQNPRWLVSALSTKTCTVCNVCIPHHAPSNSLLQISTTSP